MMGSMHQIPKQGICVVCFAFSMLGCDSPKQEDTALPFNEGPVLSYSLPDVRLVDGDSFTLEVEVQDDDGIEEVIDRHTVFTACAVIVYICN